MTIKYYSNEDNNIYCSVLVIGDSAYLLKPKGTIDPICATMVNNSPTYNKLRPFYATKVGLEILKLQYPRLKEYL